MQILSPLEIKEADKLTGEKQGITSFQLMERAASGFASAFLKKYPESGNGIIICGPGNNGGDGLAVARLLSKSKKVSVFIPDLFNSFSKDYEENLIRIPASVKIIKGDSSILKSIISDFDWVCDALFGIGLNRKPEGEILNLIQIMNGHHGLKLAIDVPSGFGEFPLKKGKVFEADWVGTFHAPKLGFLFPESQSYLSEFEVIDIQLEIPDTIGIGVFFLQKSDILKLLMPRKKYSYKGTFGHALLVAGSEGKMGAAVLAASAMLRSGVGLVSVLVPKIGRDVLQIACPEAMVIVDKEKREIGNTPPLGLFQSIGVGPGIGKSKKTQQVVKHILERAICPLVLDADALNILAENKEWLELIPHDSILTPHPKEFERLTGKASSDREVFEKALLFSAKYQVVLILKSAHTLICFPDGNAFFNSTGNPGMAKGGSGDVLAGFLTGLLASGYSPFDASLIGVYLHGLSGDIAAKRKNQIGMTATDLYENLGLAMDSIQNQA